MKRRSCSNFTATGARNCTSPRTSIRCRRRRARRWRSFFAPCRTCSICSMREKRRNCAANTSKMGMAVEFATGATPWPRNCLAKTPHQENRHVALRRHVRSSCRRSHKPIRCHHFQKVIFTHNFIAFRSSHAAGGLQLASSRKTRRTSLDPQEDTIVEQKRVIKQQKRDLRRLSQKEDELRAQVADLLAKNSALEQRVAVRMRVRFFVCFCVP